VCIDHKCHVIIQNIQYGKNIILKNQTCVLYKNILSMTSFFSLFLSVTKQTKKIEIETNFKSKIYKIRFKEIVTV